MSLPQLDEDTKSLFLDCDEVDKALCNCLYEFYVDMYESGIELDDFQESVFYVFGFYGLHGNRTLYQLIEEDYIEDPDDLKTTRSCLDKTGISEISLLIEQALSLEKRTPESLLDFDKKIWDLDDTLVSKLTAYIRVHSDLEEVSSVIKQIDEYMTSKS